MNTQARVAARRSRAQIGRELDVLIEGDGERPGTLAGRTRDQAPEIDGQITVGGEAAAGDLVRVRVTNADVYDLSGVILSEPTVDLG
jgi:ribosomal protein S12 methylthiotransferase